ncbi:hypothetical protein BC830DRAFT_1118588 [Chytriomyces sp. MP71]|nr:hypothetical protein BC830DRAFT_1118588 [Chytriomyces sp. MP71]
MGTTRNNNANSTATFASVVDIGCLGKDIVIVDGQAPNGSASKVPLPTIDFWIVKVLCTTVGETVADSITNAFNGGDPTNTSAEGPTCGIMIAILVLALFTQFYVKKYIPSIYWINVILISVVGTLITDNLVDNLGVQLWQTTLGFSLALAFTFCTWFYFERTLSIHSITTMRRESFYWLTILFTFALGTSAGDELSTDVLQDVYWQCLLLFIGVIVTDGVGYFSLAYFKPDWANDASIPAFWIAYILTRPLGASLGDLLSQDVSSGGLGLGAATTSIIFLAVILYLICIMEYQQRAKQEEFNFSWSCLETKVPPPTIDFWIVKILCTTIGETAADALTITFAGGDDTNTAAETPTCLVMLVILIIVLWTQFYFKRYVPVVYWIAVMLLSVVGTLITDNIVDNGGVPLWQTTVGFSCAVILAFALWLYVEGTLSIHSINTVRREAFYWLVVLCTFALGTSAGDELSTDVLQDVYWQCILVFAGAIGIDVMLYYAVSYFVPAWEPITNIVCFWIAYILTRPLGASLGDQLSQSQDNGGAGLGAPATSGIFLAVIVCLLVYMHARMAGNGRLVCMDCRRKVRLP